MFFRTQNLTVSLVQEWYEDRAEEIDTNSCMVQNAFELIKFAILHGFHVRGLVCYYVLSEMNTVCL